MTLMKFSDNVFPSIMDNIFSRDWMDWSNTNYSSTNTTLPAVNVFENENEYNIEVAAPGMKKDDFRIQLENDQLIISSEHKEETKKREKDKYTRKEFSYQAFQRTFSLPENLINGEKISARYCDGILCISLPKREDTKPKPSREIKIL